MNGNGKLTETENVIFLRKLPNYYGNLTDERNSYVVLKRSTDIRLRIDGNVTLETRRNTTMTNIKAAVDERFTEFGLIAFASKSAEIS